MEILSQSPIIEQVSGITIGWGILLFFLYFLAFALFLGVLCELEEIGIFIAFVASIVALILTIAIFPPKQEPTGQYEYKVILDETYPATKLYENYDVIGQDGKIYIIQDKKVED